MAALVVFLVLSAPLLLAHQAQARNNAPCQPGKWNSAYNTFLRRHIRKGLPASDDNNEWFKYIKNTGDCSRPTQSFLTPEDQARVEAVCSKGGGKAYKESLCISDEPFNFVTVRSEQGTCGIKSVKRERRHLILACEVLENRCLPVHFEGNPYDAKPDNNARACQDARAEGHAPALQMTWMCLLSGLLSLFAALAF